MRGAKRSGIPASAGVRSALRLLHPLHAETRFVQEERPPRETGRLWSTVASSASHAGARETLHAKVHARILPKDVGKRRDAILSLADARKALAAALDKAKIVDADGNAIDLDDIVPESERAVTDVEDLDADDEGTEAVEAETADEQA